MKYSPIFEADVTDEVKIPVSRIQGQLIISEGVPYIVVETRENESYEEFHPKYKESTGIHYKIGGFVKVKPETIRYLNSDTNKMEYVDWFKEKSDKEG